MLRSTSYAHTPTGATMGRRRTSGSCHDSRGFRVSEPTWNPGRFRDPQHRPGLPVHLGGIHGSARLARGEDQHGRTGPVDGQRVHRAAVAKRETRGGTPQGIRVRPGGPLRARRLLRVLQHEAQHEAPAPEACRPAPDQVYWDTTTDGTESSMRNGSPPKNCVQLSSRTRPPLA